jgi:hypothetical protein
MTINISKEICEQAGYELMDLFVSKYQHMREAWQQIEGNLSVSMNCTWKPSDVSSGAIDADFKISFKKEEINTKHKRTFTEGSGNGELFDYADEKRAKLREILFKDFRPFAATLRFANWRAVWESFKNPVLFKKFAA